MARNRLTLDLQSALDVFFLDMRARRLSPRTLEFYGYLLKPFVDFLEEESVQDVVEVQAQHIRAYLLTLEDRGLSRTTQHNVARCIRAWFNFLVREEILDASPMRKVTMPRPDAKRPVVFTREEVTAILDAAHTRRDKALVLFMLDTGMRKAEIVALDVGDVDLASGVVKVYQGKGGKDRTVFIGARTRYLLRRYLVERGNPPPDAPLWTSETTGDRLTGAGLRMLFRRLRERTGIPHLTPHTFRRTCALWCLKSGMDVYTVAAIMGHSDIATLRHYLRFIEDDLREAHHRHGPVNGWLSKENDK